MKRMKTTTKRKIAGIVAVVLVVALLLSSVLPFFLTLTRAEETQKFTVEAEIGFGSDGKGSAGTIKPLVYNVFNLTITNNSDDFNGYVQIPVFLYTQDDTDFYNNYNSQISISSGETKTISLSIPIPEAQNRFDINILDKNKKIVQTKTFRVNCDDSQWIGVLTDEYNYTYIMSKIRGIYGDVNAKLDAKLFSLNSSALNEAGYLASLRAVIIDDFDTSTLTQSQLENLKNWVYDGGVLLIGTEGKVSREDFSYIENLGEYVDCYDVNVNIYMYKVGSGCIAFNNFSLKNSSEMYTAAFDDEITYLFTSFYYDVSKTLYGRQDDIYGYRYSYYNTKSSIMPTVIFVCLYIYAAIIGDILYIILKKKNKKDMALKCFLGISLSFTAAVFIVGLSSAYNKTVVYGVAQADVGNVTGDYVNANGKYIVSSPHKGKISFTVNDASIFQVGENIRHYEDINLTGASKGVFAEIDLDSGNVEILKSTVWEKNYVTLNRNIEVKGSLENNLTYDKETEILSGSVTNNTGYTLTDCFVGAKLSDGKYKLCYIDSLADGETYVVDSADMYDIKGGDFDDINADQYRINAMDAYVDDGYFAVGFIDESQPIISINNRHSVQKTGTMFTSCKPLDDDMRFWED